MHLRQIYDQMPTNLHSSLASFLNFHYAYSQVYVRGIAIEIVNVIWMLVLYVSNEVIELPSQAVQAWEDMARTTVMIRSGPVQLHLNQQYLPARWLEVPNYQL